MIYPFNPFRVTLPVLLLLATATVAPSPRAVNNQSPQSRQVQQINPVETWPSKPKRWALVIGVDKYADTQLTTLGGSANDAKAIADALVRYAGFPSDQVILLASDHPLSASRRGNILRRLSNLASASFVPPAVPEMREALDKFEKFPA